VSLGMIAGGTFLFWPEQPASAAIGSTFLGFTNIAGGAAAQFSLTNFPDGAIFPVITQTALHENGVWVPASAAAGGAPSVEISIGGQPQVLYTLLVPTTNVPVRLVMEVRTEPTGWRSLAQRLAVRMGRNPGKWLPAMYFTNETVL